MDRETRPSTAVAQDIKIARIGNRGDGIAETVDGAMFVPFALPGETWQLATDGSAVLVTPAKDRVEPICPHFTICGGCRAQHMAAETYVAWKRGRVIDALSQAGVIGTSDNAAADLVAPLWRPVSGRPTAGRRRAALTAKRIAPGEVDVGYHARATNELVAIEACPVWVPELEAALPVFQAIADLLAPTSGDLRLSVLATETGLDLSVDGVGRDPAPDVRIALSELCAKHAIARLIVDKLDVVQRAQPQLTIDDVALRPPAATFVQASQDAEREMIRQVVSGAKRAKRVADLFCGVGTFAIALSRTTPVTAIDGDPDAVAAMTSAHNHTEQRKPIETKVRDLFREPLSRKELEAFDAVVFDPPRAGAQAQAEAIAKSPVPVVIGVSCNPQTFARDARILIDGGYQLKSVLPIDQFVFSEHVELIAAFEKPRPRKSARRRRRG